jgi:hypothetical protein
MRVSDLTGCKLMLCALQYHEGFRHQVESWPTNPVDVMIDYLQSLPTSTVIADFGCGDAKIAHTLTKHKVLSFDLVAKNDKVVACDIAKVRQFRSLYRALRWTVSLISPSPPAPYSQGLYRCCHFLSLPDGNELC